MERYLRDRNGGREHGMVYVRESCKVTDKRRLLWPLP